MKRNLSVIRETEGEHDFSKRGTVNESKLNFQKTVKTVSTFKAKDEKEETFVQDDKPAEDKDKIAKDAIKQKKKTIKEVVQDLYDTIGLISCAFHADDIKGANYQPWDVVSLSEGKIAKYMKHDAQKMLEFTSNSFLRVYPAGTRFDSSNYDPVKPWIAGAQLVSLNLQSLSDDYTLINHVFFKLNSETGYILKPDYLRSETLQVKNYYKTAFTLEFNILSGLMLQRCFKESSTELYITVRVIGTQNDDKNEECKTETINDNFLHPIFKEGKMRFSIYEDNLSFLLIKIFDGDQQVLARTVIPMMSLMEGYRNVLLYDEFCQEIENSILMCKSKRITPNK